jgi:hypothetical protein
MVLPSFPQASYASLALLVYTSGPVWVFCLCPFSLRVVATLVGVVLFPKLCSAPHIVSLKIGRTCMHLVLYLHQMCTFVTNKCTSLVLITA